MAHSTRLRFDPVGCVVTIRTGDERNLGDVAAVCAGSRIIWVASTHMFEEHFVEVHGCVVLIGSQDVLMGTYSAAAVIDFPELRRTTAGLARIKWDRHGRLIIELDGDSDANGRVHLKLSVQPERMVPRRDSSLCLVS
jgi:hypothetical protein